MSSRDRTYLRTSQTALWVLPLGCGLFLGIAWLIDLAVYVPPTIYWIIGGVSALTWIGDLINVICLQRKLANQDAYSEVK